MADMTVTVTDRGSDSGCGGCRGAKFPIKRHTGDPRVSGGRFSVTLLKDGSIMPWNEYTTPQQGEERKMEVLSPLLTSI
uniref:Uncharacterized protein n=1 Tax=Anguilla anguilla TaxID=7936 RepID=A0A0E9TLF2_ANGAN